MFFSLWRRLRGSNSGPSRGRRRLGVRHVSCRPQLDSLEDRLLPAPGAGGVLGLTAGGLTYGAVATLRVVAAAAPGPVTGPQQTGGLPPAASNQMRVTLDENAAASVIELGAVFAAMKDIHPKGGLQLSILGNTNPGLVTTDLSGADLTLTYARGKHGTATITVGATDADGVSVRETILVTVRPRPPAPTPGTVAGPAPPRAM
jgi:hypothetical protein